jgi:hypothetical protein
MKKKEKPFHLHDHHQQQQQPTHQEIHALDMTEYQNLKSPTTAMKIRLKKNNKQCQDDENGLIANMKKIIYLDKARRKYCMYTYILLLLRILGPQKAHIYDRGISCQYPTCNAYCNWCCDCWNHSNA